MVKIIIGGVAFLLFIIYDLEQAGAFGRQFHNIVRLFFLLGFVFLTFSTINVVRMQVATLAFWKFHSAFFFILCSVFSFFVDLYTFFCFAFSGNLYSARCWKQSLRARNVCFVSSSWCIMVYGILSFTVVCFGRSPVTLHSTLVLLFEFMLCDFSR